MSKMESGSTHLLLIREMQIQSKIQKIIAGKIVIVVKASYMYRIYSHISRT